MQEWTDEEVYEALAGLTRTQEGEKVLTLEDLETVIFDPRFPKRLEPLAQRLLARIKAKGGK